ncbi:MAG: thiopurine S-methyltransferase [Archangium sp.]|nr:thiopurine S-methyltransferase [Archangium sp.]
MNDVDPDFWRARWGEGRIGFHEGAPNALLRKHLSVLGEGKRVFVPLCGKAEDLAFLAAQGHQVVGVELVESAVQAFFAEHGVTPVVTQRAGFVEYSAQNITVFAGDYFACTREVLGEVSAFYDRAAVIALPESLRGPYVKLLRALVPVRSPGLVITVEYPQEQMAPPPFSVPETELRAHYAGARLECVEQVKAEGPRLGAIAAVEKCFTVKL